MARRPFDDIDELCINTIRTLAIDMVEKANSGHPGLPMGAAPMAYVLWQRHLKHCPGRADWPDRDRFVLSPGHGSALLYALLHCYEHGLGLDQLENFRQWESLTPGHPEQSMTAGVEATTGPLGQGSAVAVGMAIAERHLARRFNAAEGLVDHWTYAIVSDGDLMEGISQEAASLAGHLALGRLICLYDSNHVSLDGPTSMAFTEDVAARYRALGWQVLEVAKGDHDLEAIDDALTEARADDSRPSLIVVTTTIGFGAPNKGGSSSSHGSPLGADEAAAAKKAYGWRYEKPFTVPEEARERFREAGARGREAAGSWDARLDALRESDAQSASAWQNAMTLGLPADFDDDLPTWEPGEKLATRAAAGKAMNALAARVPELFGGDADLSGSTKTTIAGETDFDGRSGSGRNLRYGVREHAMGAIANGLAYHGGVRPFVATFLAFSDYMRTPVRLAALDRLPVVYVWTHDSLGVGEDGPTHQPVEQVTALRAIPRLAVLRPGDPNEAAECWRWALASSAGPVALILSRQGLPVLEGTGSKAREGVGRGGYVLREAQGGEARALVMATGSELHLAIEASELLEREGIPTRVVSMPCRETFDAQDQDYKDSVLPPALEARLSVEAGVTLGWERYLGSRGRALGVDTFGASAPGAVVLANYGFTAKAIAEALRALV